MIENLLYIALGVCVSLFFIGIWADSKDAIDAINKKEQDDTEFLEWVIRHVEWVVDDSGELDFWEFEVNATYGNCIYLKTARELREFWEKNVKK